MIPTVLVGPVYAKESRLRHDRKEPHRCSEGIVHYRGACDPRLVATTNPSQDAREQPSNW